MKQHIGYSEFKSLTSEQFIKIAELHYNEMYPTKKDFHLVKQDCYDAYDKSKDYWFGIQEWLTIGKMIEILKDRLCIIEFLDEYAYENDFIEEKKPYNFIVQILTQDKMETITFTSLELTDALFEAVKEVL